VALGRSEACFRFVPGEIGARRLNNLLRRSGHFGPNAVTRNKDNGR
jgi:hypothetical protein